MTILLYYAFLDLGNTF